MMSASEGEQRHGKADEVREVAVNADKGGKKS